MVTDTTYITDNDDTILPTAVPSSNIKYNEEVKTPQWFSLTDASSHAASVLMDRNYDEIPLLKNIGTIRDFIQANGNMMNADLDLMNTLKRVDTVGFSNQQLKLISDMCSMLQQKNVYDLAQEQIDGHEKSFVFAFQDLKNAIEIMTNEITSSRSEDTLQRLQQAKDHVFSAVRHLQESCPICRALKHAIDNNDEKLLLITAQLGTSILKLLHPKLNLSNINT